MLHNYLIFVKTTNYVLKTLEKSNNLQLDFFLIGNKKTFDFGLFIEKNHNQRNSILGVFT